VHGEEVGNSEPCSDGPRNLAHLFARTISRTTLLPRTSFCASSGPEKSSDALAPADVRDPLLRENDRFRPVRGP
jgi:hypothetical protein